MAKTQDQLYQSVTDRILAALESGTAPWVRPWKDGNVRGGAMPHNAITGRAYHGINVLLLMMEQETRGYNGAGWLTFKQAQERGGHVRKGEKGVQICFWKFLQSKDDDAEKARTIPMLKTYYVFHTSQCDDLELPAAVPVAPIEPPPILGLAAKTGATIHHGGDRAYYTTADDSVHMPRPDQFKTTAHYDATLLHELTHWTSHKTRCDRQLGRRFGDEAYAAEELIAEMGSAFLCAALGRPLDELQHPAYIASWVRVLSKDNRAIFTASSQAQKAADYLLDRMHARVSDDQREAA